MIKPAESLTPRQEKFTREYLIDLNGKQAAIRAGYSPKSAESQASRMLRNDKVRAAVDAGVLKQAERADMSADWVLGKLRTIAERCMQAAPVLDRNGDPVCLEMEEGEVTQSFTFQPAGATKALELIGKHLGMWANEGAPPPPDQPLIPYTTNPDGLASMGERYLDAHKKRENGGS